MDVSYYGVCICTFVINGIVAVGMFCPCETPMKISEPAFCRLSHMKQLETSDQIFMKFCIGEFI